MAYSFDYLSRQLFLEIVMTEGVRFFQKKKTEDALSKMPAKYSTFSLVGVFCVWGCFGLFSFFPLSHHDSKI